MINHQINANFESLRKSSKSPNANENSKSICVRGGIETNIEQIEEIINPNGQNVNDSVLDKEAELYGDNISTGQRTDSGLNQSSINNSEENNLESKNNVISQENKEKNKNKKKRKNFVRKSDCLEGESIT